MTILAVAALLAWKKTTPLVEFPARQYPYSSIARILSTPQSVVECDSKIKDRIAAINLRERSVDEMRRFVGSSLDLEFVTIGSSKLRMQLSKKAAASERQKLSQYCSQYDENMRTALANALPKLGVERDSHRAREANDNANKVLYDRGSHGDDEILGSALVSAIRDFGCVPATIEEFLGHGSVRDLIVSPNVNCVMLQDLPGDDRFPSALLSFEPTWHFDPSMASDEIAVQKSRYLSRIGFVSGEAFDPYSGCLTFWEGEFSSGLRGTIYYPAWQPTATSISTQLRDPELRQEYDATRNFLQSASADVSLGKLPASSMSIALLRWSLKSGHQLIAAVSPQRDSTRYNLQETLRDQYEPSWIFKNVPGQPPKAMDFRAGQLGRGYQFWLALHFDGDVLVGRNLLSFLDDARDGPATTLEPLLAVPDEQVVTPTLREVEAAVGNLTDREMACVMATDCPYFADGFRDAIPFFRFISGLPPGQKEQINRTLELGGASISMYKVSAKYRKRFIADLRTTFLSHRYDRYEYRTQLIGEELRPNFDSEVIGGFIRIVKGAGQDEGIEKFGVSWSNGLESSLREQEARPLVEPLAQSSIPLDQQQVGSTWVTVVWPGLGSRQ